MVVAEPIRVLVLGVGGNVSQGILKALALGKRPVRVIGACIHPRSFGLYTVDKAYISPAANDASFLSWLVDVCRRERVRAIFSGVEPVLDVLARNVERIHIETGAIPIVSSPECLGVGDDKLYTCRWLRDHDFPFPRHAAAEDDEAVGALVRECGFPLIAKPRMGKGARGIFEVQDEETLRWVTSRKGYVVEESLGVPEEEYTASCFSDRDAKLRGVIVMRRELLEGTTHRAEAGDFPSVRKEAVRIAEALSPMGPCNIQMRIHRGVPVCFEINVRFSGTTAVRARFGFNDVEAALEHYVLGQPAADLPLITTGICLRYWNEAYVEPCAAEELGRRSLLDEPRRHLTAVEDYGMRR